MIISILKLNISRQIYFIYLLKCLFIYLFRKILYYLHRTDIIHTHMSNQYLGHVLPFHSTGFCIYPAIFFLPTEQCLAQRRITSICFFTPTLYKPSGDRIKEEKEQIFSLPSRKNCPSIQFLKRCQGCLSSRIPPPPPHIHIYPFFNFLMTSSQHDLFFLWKSKGPPR